jgi:uncharacterized protein (TIGR02147 family)
VSIFNEVNYLRVIQSQIELNKDAHSYKTKLALAAGCQKSFFSQVLSGAMNLASDHALGLARFWNFNSFETDYFFHLVQLARASTPALKSFLHDKLNSIRREAENLNKQFSENALSDQQAYVYYSTWYYSAIHILSTIPAFRTVASISKKLQLPEESTKRCIDDLVHMGLLTESDGKFKPENKNVHLSKDSFLAMINHGNWRDLAVKNAFLRREADLHYTAVHSCSRQDYEVIRSKMLEWISEYREIVRPSPEEELFAVTMDLFKI